MLDKPKLSEQNELGFQFGINKELTEYAHKEQYNWGGNVLPSMDLTVMEVWKDDNRIAYLIVDEKTNQPVKEVDSGYEACAVAIDALKILKNAEDEETED